MIGSILGYSVAFQFAGQFVGPLIIGGVIGGHIGCAQFLWQLVLSLLLGSRFEILNYIVIQLYADELRSSSSPVVFPEIL